MFNSIEPISLGRRLDYIASFLAYTIALSTPRGKNSRKPKFENFRIDWWKQAEEQRPTDMLAMAMRLTTATGGTIGPAVGEAIANGIEPREDDGDAGP